MTVGSRTAAWSSWRFRTDTLLLPPPLGAAETARRLRRSRAAVPSGARERRLRTRRGAARGARRVSGAFSGTGGAPAPPSAGPASHSSEMTGTAAYVTVKVAGDLVVLFTGPADAKKDRVHMPLRWQEGANKVPKVFARSGGAAVIC